MRKVRRIVSLFLVAVLILCGAVAVSATENEVDWASYDWGKFSIVDLEHEEWRSMYKWLRTEADLKLMFYVKTKTDGYLSEDMSGALCERFKSDPIGLIMALSLEEETVQTHVIMSIVYAGAYDPAEFEQLLSGLTLPENAGADAKNILVQMVRRAEENWNMDITNPQTGDPVGLAVLMIAISGLGGVFLWKKRKTVA